MSLALGWLILSGLWSLLVLNALYPPRHVTVLMLPSFFAGWLTGEPWPHHLLAMLLVALAAILFGGLEGALGWGALALTGVNAIGLLVLGRAALATRGLFDEALRALPDFEARSREDSVPSARGRQVMPLALWDGRVERLANLRYAGGRRHKLDLYRSKEGVESAPVVLQIHGGGWIIGHKRQQNKLKGVRLWGAELKKSGELKPAGSVNEFKRTNCAKWRTKRSCASGKVATGIKGYYNTSTGFRGLSLFCSKPL